MPEGRGSSRARARAALVEEIKERAREQVREVGAPALSLRAVARDLGMVSSAIYRYFPSRDDLLTALIIDAYDAVGAVAEQAVEHRPPKGGFPATWLHLARAIRGWALDAPNDYALVYGSPVPGYRAPEATIVPAARVSLVALRLVADGVAAGEVVSSATTATRALRGDFARMRTETGLAIPDDVLARSLQAWSTLFGTITFELFGHLPGVVSDYDAHFDQQMRLAASALATVPA